MRKGVVSLTAGEVFALVFSSDRTFSTIEEATSFDGILAGFYDLLKRNISAGVLRVVDMPGEPGFYREEVFGWMISQNILKNYEDQGIIILKEVYTLVEKYATKEDHEPKKQDQGGEFLPAPAGTKWNEVSIRITSNTQIRIGIKNKSQLYHLDKFKAEIITQEKMRGYLYKIINSGGVFTKEDIAPEVEKEQFKNYITRLRGILREVFGIQDDPLPFSKQAYHAQFSVHKE